jgi:predicted phage-related endonuclease
MAATPVISAQQLSDDWHETRRRYVGGSDSPSLFPEDSKYGCDVRLFFDKSGKPLDYPRTPREDQILKRGHIWESVVAFYFQEQTGLKVRKMGARVSKEHPMLAVNMDRQIIGTTTAELQAIWPDSAEIAKLADLEPFHCGPGYLECKTANEWMFKAMMNEGVHNDYILQVNHGLAVTGYKWGVFAVLEPASGDFAAFPYVFKENIAAEQIKRAEAFWANLQAGIMPEVKVNDKRCKTCVYRRSCPRSAALLAEAGDEFSDKDYVVDDSSEMVELLADYRTAAEIADQKAETVDAIKAKIKEAMGVREKVEVPTVGVRISFKTGKPPMRWDSKALEGTVKDLGRYDIPDDSTCVGDAETDPDNYVACGKPAVVVVNVDGAAHYMCEACGFKAVKNDDGDLVARMGIADLVASCRRPGEPSRPLKIVVA